MLRSLLSKAATALQTAPIWVCIFCSVASPVWKRLCTCRSLRRAQPLHPWAPGEKGRHCAARTTISAVSTARFLQGIDTHRPPVCVSIL